MYEYFKLDGQLKLALVQRDMKAAESARYAADGAYAKRKQLQAELQEHEVDLPPILRQTVKTQISLNGELSHGIVS